MNFLKAEWRKLAIANYEVDPEVLTQYIPYGTELDLWNDRCFVSLIGFMFLNTRLLGIKIPFHVNFEEVNLRFYVKRFEGQERKRGVVFIKEIVPRPALTFVANMIYKENYETRPMRHFWREDGQNRSVEYQWKNESGWQKLRLTAGKALTEIEGNSETEFITEHYWGYAKVNEHITNEYEVMHPRWRVYPVLDHQIEVDFAQQYGQAFEFLNDREPSSLMLAEGSEIVVKNKKRIVGG